VRHHLVQVDTEEAGVARPLPEEVERLYSQRLSQRTRARAASFIQAGPPSQAGSVRGAAERRALITRLLPSVGTPAMSQVSSSRRAPGSGVKSMVSPRSITCAQACALGPGVAVSAALHSVSWPGLVHCKAVLHKHSYDTGRVPAHVK